MSKADGVVVVKSGLLEVTKTRNAAEECLFSPLNLNAVPNLAVKAVAYKLGFLRRTSQSTQRCSSLALWMWSEVVQDHSRTTQPAVETKYVLDMTSMRLKVNRRVRYRRQRKGSLV